MNSLFRLAALSLAVTFVLSASVRADAPANTKTIFDFDLEPIGVGDAGGEKEAKDANDSKGAKGAEPEKSPAEAKLGEPGKAGGPADAKPPKPPKPPKEQTGPDPSKTKGAAKPAKAPDPADRGSAKGGPAPLGEASKFCHVDDEGVVTVDKTLTFALKGTEGKNFKLTGEVFLPSEPVKAGFMFYLRQIDGGHRINFDPQQLTAKRLLIGGTPFRKIVSLMTFDPPRDKWLPLLVDFRADGADVKLGSQAVSAKGATEINGTNTLVLRPGVKLRKVKLEAGEPKP